MRDRRRQLLWIWLALLTVGLPGAVCGQEAQDTGPAAPTALVVFMTRDYACGLPLSAAEMRAAFTEALEAALQDAGLDLVPVAGIMPLIAEWRVRSGMSLSAGFLADLAGQHGADDLMVADLIIKPRQMLLLTRLVHIKTGTVRGIGLSAVVLDQGVPAREAPAAEAWLAALPDLCAGDKAIAARYRDRQPADLVVLPVKGIACGDDSALVATLSLLHTGMALIGRPFYDPGLVVASLRERGIDPRRLAAAGRVLIGQVFHADTIVIPELISFAPETIQAGPGVSRERAELTAGAVMPAFSLTARRIAVGTGLVRETPLVYRDDGTDPGWFGQRHRWTLIEQMEAAAAQLWSQMSFNPEEP